MQVRYLLIPLTQVLAGNASYPTNAICRTTVSWPLFRPKNYDIQLECSHEANSNCTSMHTEVDLGRVSNFSLHVACRAPLMCGLRYSLPRRFSSCRCDRTMNHDKDCGSGTSSAGATVPTRHNCEKRCVYQAELDNKVYLCRVSRHITNELCSVFLVHAVLTISLLRVVQMHEIP